MISDIAKTVWRNGAADQPEFSLFYGNESLLKASASLPQGFDFSALKNYAYFIGVENFILKMGFSVCNELTSCIVVGHGSLLSLFEIFIKKDTIGTCIHSQFLKQDVFITHEYITRATSYEVSNVKIDTF